MDNSAFKRNEAKILLVGDSSVGKSSIMMRFIDNFFNESMTTTVGADFKSKRVKVDDTELKLIIWDTAGQEKYRSLAQNFYKNALGVFIVFDITNRATFTNIEGWVKQVQKNTGEEVIKWLLGNKADLESERQVSKEEIDETCRKLSLQYLEVSAKSGTNINTSFMNISKDIKNKYFSNDGPLNTGDTKGDDKKDLIQLKPKTNQPGNTDPGCLC
jgi:small GTP-binding protein